MSTEAHMFYQTVSVDQSLTVVDVPVDRPKIVHVIGTDESKSNAHKKHIFFIYK